MMSYLKKSHVGNKQQTTNNLNKKNKPKTKTKHDVLSLKPRFSANPTPLSQDDDCRDNDQDARLWRLEVGRVVASNSVEIIQSCEGMVCNVNVVKMFFFVLICKCKCNAM